MKLTAVSPFGREFEGEVEAVVVDTNEGRHVLLPEHADFIGFFALSQVSIVASDVAARASDPSVAVGNDASASVPRDQVLWAAFGYIHVFAGEILLIAQLIDEDESHVRAFHDGVAEQKRLALVSEASDA